MNLRSLVSITTVSLASMALLTGCPEEQKPGATGAGSGKTVTPTPGPSGSGGATKPASGGGDKGAFGKNTLKVTVKFTGEDHMPMEVPKKRKDLDHCKTKEIKHNAIVVNKGMLKDVWVGIANEALSGEYEGKGASIDQKDCVYEPRVVGVVAGGKVTFKNSDPTSHNINAKNGTKPLFNIAHSKGAKDEARAFDDVGIMRLQCDMHSFMRAFVVVSDNPFYGVTGDDGTTSIAKVPDGKVKIVAFHSFFGKKEKEVDVTGGEVTVEFEYDGSEEEPSENSGELDDLFEG